MWWRQQDSNLWPHGCEPCALTNWAMPPYLAWRACEDFWFMICTFSCEQLPLSFCVLRWVSRKPLSCGGHRWCRRAHIFSWNGGLRCPNFRFHRLWLLTSFSPPRISNYLSIIHEKQSMSNEKSTGRKKVCARSNNGFRSSIALILSIKIVVDTDVYLWYSLISNCKDRNYDKQSVWRNQKIRRDNHSPPL